MSKAVHFSLSDEATPDDNTDNPSHPHPRKRLTQPSTPVSVFGLCLTEECLRKIGCTVLPPDFASTFGLKSPAYACYHVGLHHSNAHCQDIFPDIPLRWRKKVIVQTATNARPVVVLGHRNSAMDGEVYVTQAQMKRIRGYLELGDQEPAWYKVLY
ncbi:hypothetical protein HGRIS_001138 [Hohenbuehelia grisea]|uniref:Uncharacterized protein n=1 Tax=Hohenbuehelia grisea TaxID=104357 RepID=A0ABR3JPE6_9AGAR